MQFRQRGRFDTNPATRLLREPDPCSARTGRVERQIQQALGSTKLETQTFNAGPAAIEALNSGAIDATFIGPNPAISAWTQSNGSAIKIISGATSGGAELSSSPASLQLRQA